jgi:hypothetical protein
MAGSAVSCSFPAVTSVKPRPAGTPAVTGSWTVTGPIVAPPVAVPLTGGEVIAGSPPDPIQLAPTPTSKKNVAVPDTRTTGILVGSASPIWVQIRRNTICNNHYGIFLEGVGRVVHATLYGNRYRNVTQHVKRVVVR